MLCSSACTHSNSFINPHCKKTMAEFHVDSRSAHLQVQILLGQQLLVGARKRFDSVSEGKKANGLLRADHK